MGPKFFGVDQSMLSDQRVLREGQMRSRHVHVTERERDQERNMQTLDEEREHCRSVGKGIEKMVADWREGQLPIGGVEIVVQSRGNGNATEQQRY